MILKELLDALNLSNITEFYINQQKIPLRNITNEMLYDNVLYLKIQTQYETLTEDVIDKNIICFDEELTVNVQDIKLYLPEQSVYTAIILHIDLERRNDHEKE